MTTTIAPRAARILLVEDNPGDILLARKALAKSPVPHTLDVVETGEEAIDFLRRQNGHEGAKRPDLVLLDLNLPGISGQEVLEEVKSDTGPDELAIIPVVVLTSSPAETDILRSYRLRCNHYLLKPIDPMEFARLTATLKTYWFEAGRTPPNP